MNLTPYPDELLRAEAAGLPTDTPMMYSHVSQTQLSIARHYGAATINGRTYIYDADADTLIRDDVLAFVRKLRRESQPEKSAPAADTTGDLFEDKP